MYGMNFIQHGILLCWLVFWAVWLIAWFHTKPSKVQQSTIDGLAYRLLLWLAFALLFSNFYAGRSTAPLFVHMIPETAAFVWAGFAITVCGLIAILSARYSLGRNWSASMDLKEGHQLVTSGLYGYIRHPIYAALLTMFLGSAIVFGTLSAFVGFVFALISCLIRIKHEDSLMAREFPTEHPAYVARTKRLIPFIY
jgi:protein-S-isoprenylcysteine O-methyltransferase Ste14